MITYEQKPSFVRVFLDGKAVGKIKAYKDQGFRYYADGFKDGGVIYQTVLEVMHSLERQE